MTPRAWLPLALCLALLAPGPSRACGACQVCTEDLPCLNSGPWQPSSGVTVGSGASVLDASALPASSAACALDDQLDALPARETATMGLLTGALGLPGLVDFIPSNATFLIPTNDATDALLEAMGFDGLSALTDPDVASRLSSVILAHVLPGTSGPLAPGTADTALAGATVQVSEGADGVAIVDGSGASARVVGGPVEACGATYYLVDQALLPAPVASIQSTGVEQAAALMKALEAEPVPAPAPVGV